MGEMRTIGKEGDVKAIWDKDNKDEVAAAEETFNRLKKKGYFGYTVKANGKKGDVLDKFDPDAEKIIMALPMRGG